MPGTVLVPYCFRARPQHGTPISCSWHKPGQSGEMAADQVVALDPAMKLKTDVTGRAL